MREPAGQGVTQTAFAAAAVTPLIVLGDPAGQNRPVWFKVLPCNLQPELIETREGSQVKAREGSVKRVEVLQMGGVRTPIIGTPRASTGDRRAPGSTPPRL